MSAILAHYALAEVPIGARRPLSDEVYVPEHGQGEFASKIAKEFAGGSLRRDNVEDSWEPVALYRRLLSEADDNSVTIASIGFFENVSLALTNE